MRHKIDKVDGDVRVEVAIEPDIRVAATDVSFVIDQASTAAKSIINEVAVGAISVIGFYMIADTIRHTIKKGLVK